MGEPIEELRKPRFPVKFPTSVDGELTITADELEAMVAAGEVEIKAKKIRPVFITRLADFHRERDPTVRASDAVEASREN